VHFVGLFFVFIIENARSKKQNGIVFFKSARKTHYTILVCTPVFLKMNLLVRKC